MLDDPRVELKLADGRNHLFGTSLRFDAIVGDLFVPWHAGTGYLYTVEHFRNVRERLHEGGVFAQWLQLNQISLGELQSLTASFTTAFDDAELWRNDTQRAGRCSRSSASGERAGAGPTRVDRMSRVCGAELLRRWSAGAVLNTDDRPFIEFSAAASHLGSAGARAREVASAIDWLRSEELERWIEGDGAR